jgi:hypothetical protein
VLLIVNEVKGGNGLMRRDCDGSSAGISDADK